MEGRAVARGSHRGRHLGRLPSVRTPTSPRDVTERRSASRIKPASRGWFVAAGLGLGAVVAAMSEGRTAGTRALLFAAGPLVGAAMGALVRRDRCSVCGGALPVRVLDGACPSCRNAIVAVVDGERRVELPLLSPRAAITDRPAHDVPYRAGGRAARDAEERALEQATRTDVEARVARLREDPAIAAALEDHDERELHRLVRARRRKARSIAEEVALDALLADPRRQLVPTRRPWLGARAGSGLVLTGARDQDKDDASFIAEQLLVVGTYPVAPLGSYLARRREDGGVDILGSLPLPTWMRVWRAAVGIPAAALVALSGWALAQSLFSRVHLLNGLDVPVTVRVDRELVRLPPGQRVVYTLARGAHHLVTRDAQGRIVEELDLSVPGGDALVVYDVAGAAPLASREVFYSQWGKPPQDLAAELIVGRRVLVKEGVEYAFVDAPRRLALNGELRTWEVTQSPAGWRGVVRAEGSDLEAVALIESVALAEPEYEDAVDAAATVIEEREGSEGARAFLGTLAARAPGSPAVKAAIERLDRPAPTAP